MKCRTPAATWSVTSMLEHLPCKTVRGLITHVAAKMASHALKLLLRRQTGIDVRTFTVAV